MSTRAGTTLRVTLPSDTGFLHLVTNLARNAARVAGLSEGDAKKVALATDEAVTNVIEHAYHGAADRSLEILIEIDEHGIEVRIIHDGDPVDEDLLPRKIDIRGMARSGRKGGLGVVLMRRLMDRVVFQPTGDRRNECCLWKGKGPTRDAKH